MASVRKNYYDNDKDIRSITLYNVNYLPINLKNVLKSEITAFKGDIEVEELEDLEETSQYVADIENKIKVLNLFLKYSKPIKLINQETRRLFYKITKEMAENWSVEISFDKSSLKENIDQNDMDLYKILNKLESNSNNLIKLKYKFNSIDAFRYTLIKSDIEWQIEKLFLFIRLKHNHLFEYSSKDFGNTKPADPRAHYGGNRRSTKNRINKSKNKKTKRSNKKH